MRIHGATLVDGTGADPRRDAVVIVVGERVTYAGDRAHAPDTPGAHVVDGTGLTLFPGFIDCHVHLCFVTGTVDLWNPTLSEPHMLVYAKMLRNLRVTLEAGVTSVRDMFGMDAGFVQAVAQGLVPGPRLQTSVSGITARGGHFDFRLPAGYDPVPDVLAPDSFISIVSGADQARDAARRAIAAGASVIKIAATGGVVSPADSYVDVGLTSDEVAAIVDIARTHQGGIPVAAHAEGTAGAEVALRAGVTSLRELSLMIDHGATPMQAVIAGTRTAAELLGEEAEIGSVEVGKLADLVLAAGDAALDLEEVVRGLADTSRVAMVVQGGRIVMDRRG